VLLLPAMLPATQPALPLATQPAAAATAAAATTVDAVSVSSSGSGSTAARSEQQQQQQLAEAAADTSMTLAAGSNTAADPAAALLPASNNATEEGDNEEAVTIADLAEPQVVIAVAVGEVQDHGDGSYSCSYSHTVAGAYELHVLNGEGLGVSYVIRSWPLKRLLNRKDESKHCNALLLTCA
jgi:alkylation response protein AidB-like acyl-CoA dehydrogenase